MATIANLDINLRANTAEFDTKLEKAEKQATNFNRSLEKQIATFGMTSREAKIYGFAQRGVSEDTLKSLRALDAQISKMEAAKAQTAALAAQQQRLRMETTQLANQFGPLGRGAATLASGLGPIGIAAVAVGAGMTIATKAVHAFNAAVSQQLKDIDDTNDMAIKLGISYADLARLGMAAQLSGSSLEEVGKAAAKLQMNLGNGSDKTIRAVAKLGLGLEELKNLPVTEAMARIADGFGGLTTQADKAAVATALFGKSGQDLIQFLDGGGARIRQAAADADRFGASLSGIDAEAVGDANDEWDRATEAMSSAFKVITVDLAPAIQATAIFLTEASVAAKDFGESMGGAFGSLEKLLTVIAPELGLIVSVLRQTGVLDFDWVKEKNAAEQALGGGGGGMDEDPLESASNSNDKLNRMAQDAARAFEQTRTPLEKYNAELADLTKLLAVGAIDFDTFGRATKAADEAFKKTKIGKMEDVRPRTAEEIAPGLKDKFEPDNQIENRLADAMRRGSLSDYQTRIANRGTDPAAEAVKFQKETVAEAKKTNQLLSDIQRDLPQTGVHVVEIA